MDVIASARELGKLIQKDARYLRLQEAAAANEADGGLQQSIERFNALRAALGTETAQTPPDGEKVAALNAEFHAVYDSIMQTPTMQAYEAAKNEATETMNFIYQIITGSFNGFDPEQIEYRDAGCPGGCDTCGACGK